MDTTPKYILMSGKSEEIQANWKPEIGRYFNSSMGGICIYTGRVHKSGWTFEVICENDIEGREIWLPRQDELQEMLIETKLQNEFGYELAWLRNLFDWATEYSKRYSSTVYTDYARNFRSLEQLWLAFVMHEKYQKIWSGKYWIIE